MGIFSSKAEIEEPVYFFSAGTVSPLCICHYFPSSGILGIDYEIGELLVPSFEF
jgi:hypothetical protein